MAPHSGSNPRRHTSWKMSLDAPHVILDAAGYPRYTAATQSTETQAQFAHFYPNGLPVTYHMLHGHDSGGVPQEYMENHLPVRFYTHPPPNAIGKFSTMYGELKEFGIVGELLPERRVHLWNYDEIQSVCKSLRQVFWGEMKNLRRPTRWDDLWEYFDAVDLYHYGVLNIWNVMNTLFDETRIVTSTWSAEMAAEIGHFTDEWVKDEENQEKLKAWDEMKGPVLCCLTSDDWTKIRNLQDGEIAVLKSALEYRRQTLISGNVPQANRPADAITAYYTNNLSNWLAGAPVFGRNGLPPPPASAPYHGRHHGMNATAPCFVRSDASLGNRASSEGGQGTSSSASSSSAVEALQKSAAAATTKRTGKYSDVVVCMGSSRIPPGWEKTTTGVSPSQKTGEKDSSKEAESTPPEVVEKESQKTTLDEDSKSVAPKVLEQEPKPDTAEKESQPKTLNDESKPNTQQESTPAASEVPEQKSKQVVTSDTTVVKHVFTDVVEGKKESEVTSDGNNSRDDSVAYPSDHDADQNIVAIPTKQTDVSKSEKDAIVSIVTECQDTASDTAPTETDAQPA
ncbi:hypothetical protein CP533_4822 [Ophiocordyceps camponoti-saundersi (nom. inval.)]|nr:hypothetical protein CP533_4822 [Ophiocordyceps camponoti-saundersi (nom. inval.)]